MDNIYLMVFQKYGLPICMLFMMAGLFTILLKWVMRQSEKLNKQSIDREEKLLSIIGGHQKALEDHTLQAKDFHSEMKQAMHYNRKEHEQLMENYKEAQIYISNGFNNVLNRIMGINK